MVLSMVIHLEGSKETNRSSSKKDVKTKAVSSDIQLRGSHEASRSPSKQEVETKRF
jgi:hypothetical protein